MHFFKYFTVEPELPFDMPRVQLQDSKKSNLMVNAGSSKLGLAYKASFVSNDQNIELVCKYSMDVNKMSARIPPHTSTVVLQLSGPRPANIPARLNLSNRSGGVVIVPQNIVPVLKP